MTGLYLYDDARARSFEPFALTRPAGELRAGVDLIRARWERAAGVQATATIAAAHLAAFEEAGAPPTVTAGQIPAGSLVASSRCVIALDAFLGDPSAGQAWSCDGRIAAVMLDAAVSVAALSDPDGKLERFTSGAAAPTPINGRWIDEVWDLTRDLVMQLGEDIPRLARFRGASSGAPSHSIVLGDDDVYIEAGAVVEPQVCFDTGGGPIYVSRGATVRSFTRIGGPCFIGRDSLVMGDRVAASAIGDSCRVHGEVSNSVFLAYTNKAHDGFVGHSYFGRWVNLGAGTTTSNLKNTYGPVSLWTPEGIRDTGQQFLGTFAGDHAKTGIGLRLTTGTVLGAGANVFDRMPPKYVDPFTWGDGAPYGRYRLDKFLEVAARVMERRHVTLAESCRRQLSAAYAAHWGGGGEGR